MRSAQRSAQRSRVLSHRTCHCGSEKALGRGLALQRLLKNGDMDFITFARNIVSCRP
jgi:hypothetical protein